MPDSSNDYLSPNVLLLPSLAVNLGASKPGDIGLSGGKIVFYTGTAWELVTSS